MDVVGAKDDVHPRVFLLYFVHYVLLLHHAPADTDDKVRSLLLDPL